MKKLLLLTKTLLAASLLCVGQSAWAYDIPTGMEVKEVLIGTLSAGSVTAETFDEDGATVPSFTNSGNFSISDAVPTDQWNSLATSFSGNVLRLGSKTTHEIDFSSTLSSGKVVFSADFYVGINQKIIKFIDEDNQVVARFVFPDKNASNGRVYGTQYMYVDVDDAATFSSTPKINDTYLGTRNREYRITELVIDLDANTITYSGKVMDRRNGANNWCDDNATITLSKSVTIKGMIIDASGVGNNTYYAYYDNMKLYSVGNAAGTYNYTINAVAGGTTIKQLAVGSTTKGNTYGTYLPKAILYNSQYYVLNDANVSNFYASYTMGDADATKEITYTLNANMKAFWEGENLDYVGHNWYSGGNQTDNADCSNGAAQCPYSGTSNGIITSSTIASGIYDITIKPYRWNDVATEYTLQYSTDNTNWTTIETVSFAANSNDAYVADNVLIPGDSYLRLLSPSSTPRHAIDYIYVERTGEVATIGTYGYATFSSTSPVNVNVTGLEAYIATEKSGDYVTMQKVTGDVAANTGLVLKGSAGNYALPFAASGTSYSATNKLFALDGSFANVSVASKGTNYVMVVQDEEVVWAPVKDDEHLAPAPAGHAALWLDGAGARSMGMSFVGDITAVENVDAAPAEAKEGKFIENGKLVIVKNGVKYNAAGAQVK